MNLELYSPEEVSEMLRGKVSAWTIRKLAREKKIEHTRIERGKILFTQGQVKSFLVSCTRPASAVIAVEESVLAFQGTGRSRKSRAGVG